jgi:hypothetical protein
MAQFNLTPPSQYKGNQVILNSDRLLFNAKSDAILMFSSKAIGLSSGGTLNFDSDDTCIISSPKISLGLKEDGSQATEPLLLGNQTEQWLKTLIEGLQLVVKSLENNGTVIGKLEYVNMGVAAPAQNLSEVLISLKNDLKNIKSIKNFTT